MLLNSSEGRRDILGAHGCLLCTHKSYVHEENTRCKYAGEDLYFSDKRQAQDDPNVWLSLGGATGAAPGTAASN
jgi:hypothetical protein